MPSRFHLTPRCPHPFPARCPSVSEVLTSGILPARAYPTAGSFAVSILRPGALRPTLSSHPDAASTAGDCSPNPNGAAAYANDSAAAAALVEAEQAANSLNRLGSLKPLGQLRESFILAAGDDGLWIIDQHVAHERVLFEKILRDRQVERVQRQRLLMPMLVELKPEQMVVFARIAEELEVNGFEVEPFGPQTLAVKAPPLALKAPSSSACSPRSSINPPPIPGTLSK
jgi:DNA mismatch repair protein MutL